MKVLDGNFRVGSGITGRLSPMQLAVADAEVGPAQVRNAVFLVLDDKNLYIEPVDYSSRHSSAHPS